jgi:hypothetical protein
MRSAFSLAARASAAARSALCAAAAALACAAREASSSWRAASAAWLDCTFASSALRAAEASSARSESLSVVQAPSTAATAITVASLVVRIFLPRLVGWIERDETRIGPFRAALICLKQTPLLQLPAQCDISTGTVMCARMSRVTPPSTNSRSRECP